MAARRRLTPSQQSKRGYGYDRTSPEFKARLAGIGIGRDEYVQGYSIKSPPPLTKARREAAVARVGSGQERRGDMGIVQRWYNSAYIRPELRGQPGLNKAATAATLSQVPDWSKVTSVAIQPSSSPVWDAVVTMKGGRTTVIEVPVYVLRDFLAFGEEDDIDIYVGES